MACEAMFATNPLYALARTELPQLIWGTTYKGASAILRAWGIRYLATVSTCELQKNTNPNSHNMYASKNLSTVSCSASSSRQSAYTNKIKH
jgi:hypothetical protein